jgi:hypothetical protein
MSLKSSLCASLIGAAFASTAASAAPIDTLMSSRYFGDLVEVLVDEGRATPDDFGAQMGVPQVTWELMLAQLYDAPALTAAFRASLETTLEQGEVEAIQTFYDTDLGQRLAQLELEGRKAISDEDVLSAAVEVWSELPIDTPRAMQIDQYVEANDLVESNIVSSMNSDIAYLRGFTAGAGESVDGSGGMSEDELLRSVWLSEPDVRARVSEWVYGFSMLAYDTLTEDEFAAYIAFCESEQGQALNTALFTAFDVVYEDLSYALGAGTAQLMRTSAGPEL